MPSSPSAAPPLILPSFTSVAGSATMSPAFFSPMKVRKIPMPAAAPTRRPCGMLSAIQSRSGVAEMMRKSTPDQNTIPRAMGQGICFPRMSEKVKKALMPMPGATAKGRLAYRPISKVPRQLSSTVAVITPLKGRPVPSVDRIAGFTTTM